MGDSVRVDVRAGGRARDYPVWIEPGALGRIPELARRFAPAHRFAVIADATVAALYGSRVIESFEGAARLHVFPAGEASKSRST